MAEPLNEWEKERLSEIGQDLATDRRLGRVLFPPSRHERRRARVRRRFYPSGYLLCALLYMLWATEPSELKLVAVAGGLGVAVWLLLEIRTLPPRPRPR